MEAIPDDVVNWLKLVAIPYWRKQAAAARRDGCRGAAREWTRMIREMGKEVAREGREEN